MQINLQKFQVNEDTREITFTCASDTPYQRYDEDAKLTYNQILVISEDAVDLSRLNNSAPLLFNHDTDKLLGVVEKAWVQGDRIFVRVRFSKNDAFADRIYKDILDGIIKNVSIGYVVEDYEDKKQNGEYNRYVTKWMIYEASIVSIPADTSVGIRQLNIKDNKMEEKIETKIEQVVEVKELQTPVKDEVEDTVNEQAVEEAQEEVKACDDKEDEIKKLREENEALKEQIKACEKVEEKACEVDEETKEEIEKIGADFDVPQEEIKSAIEQKLSVKEFKNIVKNKSFNIINKKEIKTMKHEFRDFLAARDFDKPFVMRDFTGFADEALVGTETTPLVAALDKRLGLSGYRAINGLHSNISIPVETTRVQVGAKDICAPADDSNPEFTNVTLSPNKITGSVLICKQMLANTNSDVEAYIIDALLKEITYQIEAMMLGKVATAAATEINYASINSITWADILAMEAALGGYMLNSTSFVMSPACRASLKATPKAENTIAGFICEGNEVNGYRVDVSGVVGNDNIYFGDWSELVLGTWGDGIEILVDPYTESRAGNVIVVASALVDAAVVQPDAFCLGKVQESSSSSSASSN